MLPQAPPVTRCPGCNRFYWVADAPILGEIEPVAGQPIPQEWAAARPVSALTGGELLQALEAGLGSDPAREKRLRILAWWAANDARRPPAFEPDRVIHSRLPVEAEANLQRLFDLLDPDDPEDRLFKAEAARELGSFSAAAALLEGELPKRYKAAADRLRMFIELGDDRVHILVHDL
jgi:hypothetical protein